MDTWNAESDANRISTLIPLRGWISDESGHIHTSYSYSWHAVVAWSMRVQVRKSHPQCTRGVIRSTSAMGTWDVDWTCLDAQRFLLPVVAFLAERSGKTEFAVPDLLVRRFLFYPPFPPHYILIMWLLCYSLFNVWKRCAWSLSIGKTVCSLF